MAIATTTDIHFRIDKATKEESEQILDKIGISMSDLFNMTLKRLIRTQDIPFNTRIGEGEATTFPGRSITTRNELSTYLSELAFLEPYDVYHPASEVFSRIAKRF